jgi:Zn-dependent protease with chaperone function
MDFFASQEKARRKSTMLVLLFLVATVGIVATVYLLIFILLLLDAPTASQAWRDMRELADVLLWLGVIIVSIIGLGTLFKMAQLRRGGAAVAELLGGTPLAPDTRVPEEARVRNVVEEMAIASGLPVPPVYILEQEQGINAFAAGQSPGDAVIGLTSGCARQLNRAELQAVIGHEFSHILNGDMRLNIRLMSVIHGLIILGLAGRVLLHMAAFGGSSRDRKGSALPLLLGAGFLIVGSLGMFLGSLIKAAISRQREYLADASSVQFTRDASAMAKALKKIGALSQGSRLEHRNAAQASHMFFAQGVTSYMNSLFATHPPLDERIRRVEPNWDGNYPVPGSAPDTPLAGQGATEPAHGGPTVTPTRPDQDQAETFGFSSLSSPVQAATDKTGPSAAAITASVGQLDELHVAYARRLKQRIPDELTQAAHDPLRAHEVVLALLLDKEASVAAKQIKAIDEAFGADTVAGVRDLAAREPAVELRMPLLDICFPALRRMPFDRYPVFRNVLLEMIRADGKVGLFEWALHRAVLRHLEPAFVPAKPRLSSHTRLAAVKAEAGVILSALAHVGAKAEDATRVFDLGAKELDLSGLVLRSRRDCGIQALDKACAGLNRLREPGKRKLITACTVVITADGMVTVAQAEILRAVADALECPMPPLLPGQMTPTDHAE